MGITQTKLQQKKKKNKELKQKFRETKREILKELKTLEEKVKDLMYVGDLK